MISAAILPSLGIVPEIAVAAIPSDERVWVPQAADVWFRPLLLNTVSGGWCNLLRVRRSDCRHRHPMVVVGYAIRASGASRALIADEEAVYEPPVKYTPSWSPMRQEMINALQHQRRHGLSRPSRTMIGYEDVFSKIKMPQALRGCGLGADYIDQFIR